MRILAYTDRFSVTQGETVAFMASCEPEARVRFSIERILCADAHPDGPGFKVEAVDCDQAGLHPVGHHGIDVGSRVELPVTGRLSGADTLEFSILFWPTLAKSEDQCLFAGVGLQDRRSLALVLQDGRLLARIGTGDGEHRLIIDTRLHLRRWYRATLRLGRDCQLQVEALETTGSRFRQLSATASLDWTGWDGLVRLCLAAHPEATGVSACYNGKLEAPQLQAASGDELLIDCGWAFEQGIDTDTVSNTTDPALDGRLINLPTRAVTGHAWDGSHRDWRIRPGHYAAIHFHEDDLYDAGWPAAVTWQVPDSLRSGLYAGRFDIDDETWRVPFAVLPCQPGQSADIALLLPSASYLAYANDHCHLVGANPQLLTGRLLRLREADLVLAARSDLGLSLYDRHRDGSGSHFSSWLRPILNMLPGHATWLGGPGSGLWQLGADTHLIDWLETRGFDCEVITDEALHARGAGLLAHYRVVITGTHPEYTSTRMWDGLHAYLNNGGRLLSMGANGFYWRIGVSGNFPAAIEVRRAEDGTRSWAAEPGEYHQQFDGAYGGLWRRNGRPPQKLTGVGFSAQGFGESACYLRTAASHDPSVAFIFEGVDDGPIGDFGLIGGGAAGLELDRHDPDLGSPETSIVLCTTPPLDDLFILANEEIGVNRPNVTGAGSPLIRGDVVYTPLQGGGAIFATGSIAWAGSLSWNGYDNNVSRITENVLKAFADQP